MAHRILAAVALMCGACALPSQAVIGPATAYDVHIDPSVLDAAPVLDALADWTTATGVRFTVTVATPGVGETINVVFVGKGAPLCDLATAVGCTTRGSIVVQDWSDSPTLFRQILRHEIGHALGLRHTTDPDAVMYPSSDLASLTITAVDDAQYLAVRDGESPVDSAAARPVGY